MSAPMASKKESYGLEPEDESAPAQPTPRPDHPARQSNPLPVEPEEADAEHVAAPPPPARPSEAPPKPPERRGEASASIRALDVCPNCASPLSGPDAVVCLRCGFDLKSLKVIKTAKGTKEVVPEQDDEAAEAPPLVTPGAGDLWAPAAIAIASLLLLCFGYMAGWGGLFGGEDVPGFGQRAAGLAKMLARTAVWTGAGFGGLWILASMLSARLGDLKLGAVRILAIVSAVSLVAVIGFDSRALEWTLQLVLQAGAFVGLSMALFRLSARDAATLLGFTVMLVVVLALMAAMVLWAAPPLN